MKNLTKSLFLLLFLFYAFGAIGQKVSMRQGNKNFSNLAYAEAIPFYKKVLYVDSLNAEAIHKIAECYRQTNAYDNALLYFSKAVKLSDVKSIEKYYYGQLLMITGNYSEAKKWLQLYRDESPQDERAENLIDGIKNINLFLLDSARFIVSNVPELNTPNSDFGPCLIDNKLVFSSNKYTLNSLENNHSWTNKDYYRVFESVYSDSSIAKPIKFASTVQNKYNDGPVSYDFKNKALYITRNHSDGNKTIKASDDQVKLQIYSYTYNQNKDEWENEIAFQYNNKEYNIAHPAISTDGNLLIYSSDMPGGYGGMDLYICTLTENSWSSPKNLGSTINTKGNEIFPFISSEGLLFFASDGLEGIGGLDIFYSFIEGATAQIPKHLEYPINTRWDDFSLVLNAKATKAYFSSNRMYGKGDDDIYVANILYPFKKTINIELIAKDMSTEEIIPFAEIDIIDSLGNIFTTVTTDENGKFNFTSDTGNDYMIKVKKSGYNQVEIPLTTKNINNDISTTALLPKPFECIIAGTVTDNQTGKPIADVSVKVLDVKTNNLIYSGSTSSAGNFEKWLEHISINEKISYSIKLEKPGYNSKEVELTTVIPSIGKIEIHTILDLSLYAEIPNTPKCDQIVDMNPIYFDLDKYFIRNDAAQELDKVVKFMNDCPDVKIEVRSHTDCRASIKYNNILSTNRAKATVDYIISKGINKNRLVYKGYGELQTLNQCNCEPLNDCDCTETEHQKNRRSEFLIIKN